MYIYKPILIFIIHIFISGGFLYQPIKHIPILKQSLQTGCSGDRVIYKNYLLGLRKTRRYIHNTTNINTLISILNFTNEFIINNTQHMNNYTETIEFNNTEVGIKTITTGNMVLDVSNVQYIHICTKNDKLIIELDKNKNPHNILSILERINNIDAMINTLSLLSKLITIGH